ncbi:hypothetical protein LCGC14_1565480 [marine sediment metagenome]|uniref:Uncharacterized protein n=1 Tax=marine sediment metagenome TaxID=412755 RepID=A0A0F9IL62_9ZZZZ
MAYLGPEETDEQPDLMREMHSMKVGGGTMAFRESFSEMLRRLHRERTDLMRELIRVEKSVAAVESILR